MAREYPPLNSLLVFLKSARTQSFTLAAEELFVTRSAVSRQIKGLEDELGVKLFNRSKSGLVLTDKGLEYANALSPIFADLKSATNRLRGHEENKFKLGISATFNFSWLMGRLNNFYELNPSIAIAFLTDARDTGHESVNFSEGGMDAAIRFGTGEWEGCQVDKIFDIYVQPICSPKLMNKTAARMNISDLSDYNWLGYEHLPHLWQQWLNAAGDGEVSTKKKEIELDNVSVAVQAAVDGLGIIPMYRPLADHLLDSGSLVPAHEFMMLKPEAYYFVCPLNYKEHKPTAIFREWLLSEAKSFTEKWNKNHEINI